MRERNLDEIPAGRLQTEHWLIERFIGLMKKEIAKMDQGKDPDMALVGATIDFFNTYAHRCHYGKEEGILFHSLYKKKLLPKHKDIIDELVLEHIQEKRFIAGLEIARDNYWKERSQAMDEVIAYMKSVVGFYPGHMRKEEKEFFLPSMEYFSGEEQADLLRRFDEFDRGLIHEKYIQMAEKLEGEKMYPYDG
jgi:hemerythrin-like domain-containing protein